MSNSEEKILILKMLEEGKITSEEAIRLLDAIDNSAGGQSREENSRQNKNNGFQAEVEKVKERLHEWKKEFKGKNNYKQKDFDRTIEDFVDKAEKLGKNVAVTTFGIVDKVVDFVGSFIDTNSFNIFGSCKAVERTFEIEAVEGTELFIEGVNGNIVVKKHEDNKILVKSNIRSPQNNTDELLKLNKEENNVSLVINRASNISVSHEVFLPAVNFKDIKITTTNGKIYVGDSISESFLANTRNGHIELMGVNSKKINVSTKNARIQLGYITGKDIDINTTNSLIDIKHIKTERINAVTTNGRILAENLQNYQDSTDMSIDLKTTNGWIKVNMNDMDNRGYRVKARTTNGGINLLIPQIVYNNMVKLGAGGSMVDAENVGLEGYQQKVNMNLETVNGYIEIVK
jgi:DUF4097 and DUF4098 domain-containing protein YvlB